MSQDLTDVNSRFQLLIPDLFPTPQLLQGYGTDDAFASEEVDVGETVMGVDGIMSSGFVPYIIPTTITFQANSASIPNIMEAWRAAEYAAQQKFLAQGVLAIPSIGIQYQLVNGVLQRVTPFPHAKKILQPMTYRINWNAYNALPMASAA